MIEMDVIVFGEDDGEVCWICFINSGWWVWEIELIFYVELVFVMLVIDNVYFVFVKMFVEIEYLVEYGVFIVMCCCWVFLEVEIWVVYFVVVEGDVIVDL